MDPGSEGLSITALQYLLPHGYIGESLFRALDTNKNGLIEAEEFIKGLEILYFSNLEGKIRLIFEMYDYQSKSYISYADAHLMLSYIPIVSQNISQTTGSAWSDNLENICTYDDRIKSQFEITRFCNSIFNGKKEIYFEEFKQHSMTLYTDIFICIYLHIKEKLPNIEVLQMYNKAYTVNLKEETILLPSPQLCKLWLPYATQKKDQINQLFSNPLLHQNTLRKEKEGTESHKKEEDVIVEDSPEAKQIPKMSTNSSSMFFRKENGSVYGLVPKNQQISSIHSKSYKLDEKSKANSIKNPHSTSAATCTNCKTSYEYGSTKCNKCGNIERLCSSLYLKKDKMLVRYWFKLIGQDLYCKPIIRLRKQKG